MMKIQACQLKQNDILLPTNCVITVAPVPAWETGKIRVGTMTRDGKQVERKWGKYTLVAIKER